MSVIAPKKLIEVALPLDDINREAAREKSIRHGHPSTLHLWWARRPLAAARAVIFAQMVNAPGWRHEIDHTVPTPQQKSAYTRKRNRLFDIIRDLVKWENTANEEVLKRAREEIWESWRETCLINASEPGFNPDILPPFHDPFAGGGAIPLEAQRLGLASFASDLNPVAVMINKAMIEIPPRFSGFEPMGPLPFGEGPELTHEEWVGSRGLAEDVRRYGEWVKKEAIKRIGQMYPKVLVTKELIEERPELGRYLGRELTVVAWLWARTVKSPNPEFSDVDIPLVKSFILCNKGEASVWVEPVVDMGLRNYRFIVRTSGRPVISESVSKKGALCIMSKTAVPLDYIRAEAKAGRMGSRLFAVVVDSPDGRIYLSPSDEIARVVSAKVGRPNVPALKIDHWAGCTNCVVYGLDEFGKLFSDRQLLSLTTFSSLAKEAGIKACEATIASGIPMGDPLNQGGKGAKAYGEAITTYLSFAVDKCSDYWSTMCTWHNTRETIGHTFGRQAIPMSWDYAEANPISSSSGNWSGMVGWIVKVLELFNAQVGGKVFQHDAAEPFQEAESPVVSTDPPYYDNVPYSNISDYFYLWMRQGMRQIYPQLFSTIAVPKMEELVANQFRHGGKENALNFFMSGMKSTFSNIANRANSSFPVTIYYAFKATDKTDETGSNKGWESFLQAVLESGFEVTGTWPMNTEMGARRMAVGNNALASSIVLVCRKREKDAISVSRARFVRELKSVMFDAIHDMIGTDSLEDTITDIAPVDLAQAAIGPGMGVFSKYASVLKSDGSVMDVHDAMADIRKEVEQILDPDNASYDPSTNFFVSWFKEYGFGEGAYGPADVLARAKGTTVDYLVASEVAESQGGKFRLYHWKEYPLAEGYDPKTDANLPLWEALHRVVRELETASVRKAAKLLYAMPSSINADDLRQLAYYLYTYCERKGDAENAKYYNNLVTAWSDIANAVAELEQAAPKEEQGTFTF